MGGWSIVTKAPATGRDSPVGSPLLSTRVATTRPPILVVVPWAIITGSNNWWMTVSPTVGRPSLLRI